MRTLFSYAGTGNLGDAIQTLALRRLLPGPVEYVDRDGAAARDDAGTLLANGFLDARWRGAGAGSAIFAGVHVPDGWVAARVRAAAQPGVPLGARDPWSQELLGAGAECIGCATLTLPRYAGPRHGRYAVDALEPLPDAERHSHYLPATLPWPGQCAAAEAALERYRTAEAVVTTRLHVLLPCLAAGTPVRLECGVAFHADRRWTLAHALGVEPGRWLELDVAEWAARFRAFLAGLATSP